MDDNRIYRLNHESEIEDLLKEYGPRFLQFKQDVYLRLQHITPGTCLSPIWVSVASLVSQQHLISPFIKCACMYMLEYNTLSEFWEYDEYYLHIRHIKWDSNTININKESIRRWYEKK